MTVEYYAPFAQGIYYLVTGVWPLFNIATFQKVTGPKRDLWLVKTVGITLGVIGAVLIFAGIRKELTDSIFLLAVGTAGALAAVDIIYAAKRVISPIYLLDAVAEFALIAWWLIEKRAFQV